MLATLIRKTRFVARFLQLSALASVCLWASFALAQPPQAASYDAWLQHRQSVLKDPGVVRLYTFEGECDSQQPLANLVDKSGELSLHAAEGRDDPKAELPWVEGRWSQKKAVRLDREFLAAEPLIVLNGSFSVAAWVRTLGMGAIRGNPVATGGTLFSAGSGYSDGWRVTFHYPDQVLGFEIGRQQPPRSIGIQGGPMSDGVWHHVAVTWDGRAMRIYLDGRMVGSGPYDGPYTLPPKGAMLRIGYANHGWGSVRLDVDELAVYRRPLSPVEIVREAHFYAPLDESTAARFAEAQRLADAQDFALAAKQYEAIVETASLPIDYRALARLCLARVYQAQKNPRAARAQLAEVVELAGAADSHVNTALLELRQSSSGGGQPLPAKVLQKLLAAADLPARDRVLWSFQLARRLRDDGDLGGARLEYVKLLALPELSPREKLDAQLEAGHVCFAAKQYAEARAEYAKVLSDPETLGHYKSQAQLQVAASYAREGNLPAARVEYGRLATLSGVPEHHRWEAQECLRELARVQAGLPARDPLASRTIPPARPAPAVSLYVAPNGSDENPGTLDRPLATLEKARERIRELKRRSGLPRGGAAVYLRGGEYRRTQTFTLTADDSGTAESPIVYLAYAQESPRLYAGTRLGGFAPVADPAVLARLPEPARGKVLQLDLHAAGVTDYSRAVPGVGRGPQPVLELFCNGQPLRIARWPNEGFVEAKVVKQPSPAEKRGGVFQLDDDRLSRWSQAANVQLYGYFQHLWADSVVAVASIDAQSRQIAAAPGGPQEVHEGYPYYVFNLLEELDLPGEWYLDRATGVLYVYPPVDAKQALFELSLLAAPLVELDNVSHVTFQRLILDYGQSDGLLIRGGDHCLVAGCTLCNLGGTGVIIAGGTSHGILGCDLHTLGRGGTAVSGGDRKTLTPGGHFVENCHVYDFSRIYRTYTPAVQLVGVGHRIAHNLFHDSPGHAMRVEGNDHTIELNEIHHVALETDDQGGLDMWFNPSYRGNVIRWNYWHDIANGRPCGQAGVRLDDAISGTLIYGNLFYRSSAGNFGGVQIHGGKENVVDNNVFVDCLHGVSFSPWGPKRWASFLQSDRVIQETTAAVDIAQPPYRTRYPALAHLAENPDVNSIWRNLALGCGDFLVRDRGNQDLRGNLVTDQAPGVTEVSGRTIPWKPDPRLLDSIGFRPIPLDEIGLYLDAYRPK
jgi:hypothetical protein